MFSRCAHTGMHQWHGMPCLFALHVSNVRLLSSLSSHFNSRLPCLVPLCTPFHHTYEGAGPRQPRPVNRHLPRRGVQNWPYSEQGRVLPDTSSGGPLVNPYEWRNMQRCMPWRWEATRQRPVDVMPICLFPRNFMIFQGLWSHHLAEILLNSNFVKNRWVILHSWTWHDLTIKSFYMLLHAFTVNFYYAPPGSYICILL